MPQISLIKYSDIKQARRYDSEYFKPEYLIIEKNLKKLNSIFLENYCVFIKKWIFDISPTNYRSFWIPFLRVSNTKSFFINSEDMVYLDEFTHQENWKTELNKWDIILSKVWTIWDAVINFEYEKINFSQNNVWIKIKQNLIDSAYVIAFFNSKYWRKQIEKNQSWQVQEKIVLDDIKYLKIPRLNNEVQIWKIVKTSYEKQTQSKELYKQAEEILLAELWLLNHEINHKKTFTTTKKSINEAHRFDSEYFQPKYDEIIRKIEKTWYVSLWDNESFSIITWTYSESYWEKWINYIRSVNINSDLTISPEDMYKTDLDLWNKFKVETWDIITSRVWSIWTLGYVSEEFNNSFISDNILRIRNNNNNLNNLFIAIYLKKIWTIFMERLQRWSVQQRLNQETLKEIKIPLIKPEIQKEIAEKIELSHKLKKESKELLELAKRKVEEEIEKGV